jgi:predicted RNA-binding Zn-ribbon protein involved in translation (DUF1610 family)
LTTSCEAEEGDDDDDEEEEKGDSDDNEEEGDSDDEEEEGDDEEENDDDDDDGFSDAPRERPRPWMPLLVEPSEAYSTVACSPCHVINVVESSRKFVCKACGLEVERDEDASATIGYIFAAGRRRKQKAPSKQNPMRKGQGKRKQKRKRTR